MSGAVVIIRVYNNKQHIAVGIVIIASRSRVTKSILAVIQLEAVRVVEVKAVLIRAAVMIADSSRHRQRIKHAREKVSRVFVFSVGGVYLIARRYHKADVRMCRKRVFKCSVPVERVVSCGNLICHLITLGACLSLARADLRVSHIQYRVTVEALG